MEFRYDFSDGRSDMIYDSVEGESLDVLTVRMIREADGPSCLLKMEVEEREWGYSFRYDISGVTNMMAWQEMVVPEEKEAMIPKIQRAVTELKQWYIPREELVLEQQYLYVDDMTGEVRLLCIPLKRESSSVQMPSAGLQSEIPPVTTIPPIPPQQEVPPVESLPPIPPTPDDFDLFGEIEETGKKRKGFWERKREKKAARKEEKPENIVQQGKQEMQGEIPPTVPDIPPVPEEISSIPPVGQSVQETIFPFPEYTSPVSPYVSEEQEERTMLLNQGGDEGTVLLNTQPVLSASLLRVRTQEQFSIYKNVCKIGKKASETDICISNNPALSRVHCTIRYLAGFYYLEDCHSSNFTYVDGKRAIPGEPIKLKDSCRIQMADEEFIFREK